MTQGDTGPRIAIRRSDDFAAALELAREARLEVTADAPQPLALWGAYDGDRLIGVVTLAAAGDLPIVEWVAVRDGHRRRGVAGRLLAALEEEARRRAETALWATARAPAFFVAAGYEIVDSGEERERLLAHCRDCPQRETTCRPEVVRKALGH
jgi:N-acetylglutamate synthase-like GNAT family acetyltransferase